MMCKYCKHFRYRETIKVNAQIYDTSIGRCMKSENDGFANLTIGNLEADKCPHFERWKAKYSKHDVFMGDEGVISIYTVQDDYYPRVYRVRNNRASEWSMSEEEIERDYTQIWSEEHGKIPKD